MKQSALNEPLFPQHVLGVLNDIAPLILSYLPSTAVFQIKPEAYLRQFCIFLQQGKAIKSKAPLFSICCRRGYIDIVKLFIASKTLTSRSIRDILSLNSTTNNSQLFKLYLKHAEKLQSPMQNLRYFIASNHADNIQLMLEDKRVNIHHRLYYNLLKRSVEKGNTDIIRLFIEYGRINDLAHCIETNYYKLLCRTMVLGRVNTFQWLLEEVSIDPRVGGDDIKTSAQIQQTYADELTTFLQDQQYLEWRCMDIYIKDCIKHGYHGIIQLLLQGLGTHYFDLLPYFIHESIKQRQVEVVRTFLQDDRIKSMWLSRCLCTSVKRRYIDILKLLLENGNADPKAYCKALCISARKGYAEIVKLLLEDGRADPKESRSKALRLSIHKGHADIVRLLLEDGRADPKVLGKGFKHVCIDNGYHEIANLLINDGRFGGRYRAYGRWYSHNFMEQV